MRHTGARPSCPNRNGEALIAVPEARRGALIADLRTRIAALERHAASPALTLSNPSLLVPSPDADASAWTLGVPALDARLTGGLDPAGVHEVKPEVRPEGGASAGDWTAALGFALRLAVRRLETLGAHGKTNAAARPRILWCWPAVLARELGRPYGPGFSFLGARASACLFVETARETEALWVLEEALKSASLALVIGVLEEAALTPARRLSLAAAGYRTPCLLITDPRTAGAGSTATRWRVGRRPSAVNPLEATAPGASRYGVALERSREGVLAAEALSLLLEWSDETHRFRVAAAVADRAPGAHHARRRAG